MRRLGKAFALVAALSIGSADAVPCRAYLTLEDEATTYANQVDKSDVAFVAQVVRIKPEFEFFPEIGDWIVILTGSRARLPRHSGTCVLQLSTRQVLKGAVPEDVSVHFRDRTLETISMGWRRDVMTEGRLYLFLCRGSTQLTVEDHVDVTDKAQFVPDILARLQRPKSAPRRRTTRSSGRTRVSRPVQSTGRATRRAAERGR